MSRMSPLVFDIVLVSSMHGFKRSYSAKYIFALCRLRNIPNTSSTNLRSSSGSCKYGSSFCRLVCIMWSSCPNSAKKIYGSGSIGCLYG